MKPEDILNNIMQASPVEVNQCAYDMLQHLLTRCTINLVAMLTSISRRTLYRWLDADRSLEEMDHKIAIYFLVHCVHNRKIKMLFDRPPLSHPRLAKRIIDEGNDNE